MFTGRKVDAAKELRLPFGSYCQVHDDNQVINSMMLPRSTGAVSLGPTGSIQGTYKFLSKFLASFAQKILDSITYVE
jgi:hypothetical protein